ncbi:MAG TPA: glycoside hydrolase family 2 TIM barrel-domain containing protein, partial [Phnomibacter sp.]|nr:glycoside hydrolase family 2 TIM barrel-domain containing protein [Phnomibacter sp.]
ITPHLKNEEKQEILVKVWDPTDDGPQPRGKQVKKPHGIWYTPVTGIWQTVWMEMVPDTYIASTKQTGDIDTKTLAIQANVSNFNAATDKIQVSIFNNGKLISTDELQPGQQKNIPINEMRLWSPDDPHLYDLTVSVWRKGKVVDEVRSYFAMRKISMAKDANGIQRMLLNDRFVFQYGPLDQGWWPDGLYTAPGDDALKFDIVKTKEMGFNMIRKHVKVEPARWYYHCDKLGMLVWQDMPSGDLGNRWDSRPGILGVGTDKKRTPESEAIFKTEWKAIMESLHNFPSIVVWVPFNEAWGQFKTREIAQWTMDKDPSRLVNAASGGNFEDIGHILDLHNYPEPAMPDPKLFGKDMILVLGEYGGLGLPLEGHTWQQKDNWGYQSFKTKEELADRYAEFIRRMPEMIGKGSSAAVYTQTTDVEVETNGLMTYDRRVIKMDPGQLKKLHEQLYGVKVP